jgi:L-2-hydroxyglutarate oxidase LhgO
MYAILMFIRKTNTKQTQNPNYHLHSGEHKRLKGIPEMPFKSDITIIGAGVVGLAIASQVAGRHKAVYVLEKNERFGQETSSRHSGVIHSGIYYPYDSLKAKLCVEGNHLLYELCRKHGIGYRRLGKLIVATSDEEAKQLEELQQRGQGNGAEGLKIISRRELKKLEPNVEGVAALLSPSTGIVDSHALMGFFAARAKEDGAEIAFRKNVVSIEKLPDSYKIMVEENDRDKFSFHTRMLINCAGLQCDKIAELGGIDIVKAGYKLHYCKGEYFTVGNGKSELVKRLIYPVPEVKGTGLGIHVTLDLEGRMLLGPSTQYVDSIDYGVDSRHKDSFYDSAKKILPFIEYEDLEPEMAGIRPKLQGPGEEVRDFVIRDEADQGLPGFIDLIGIESPGLTASPAIARYVAGLVRNMIT